MAESVCGAGVIREVERGLRAKVELELQRDEARKEKDKAEMSEMRGKAQVLFRDLTNRLNMCCPRCKAVFGDFDGCNALTCPCGAHFCAICLQDCGADAHSHVRAQHGDLFNKALFEEGRLEREKATIASFMHGIKKEPFEVQELIKIEVEKLHAKDQSRQQGNKGAAFLRTARQVLANAVRNDRLALLSGTNDETPVRRIERYEYKHISPRNAIPEDYQLTLTSRTDSVCTVKLHKLVEGIWKQIPLPEDNEDVKEKSEHGLVIDVLCNIRQQLRCCVIDFNHETRLYQTKSVKNDGKDKLGDDEVSIHFHRVLPNGDVDDQPHSLAALDCQGRAILGLNQNRRLMLSDHVEKNEMEKLLFPSLCHYFDRRKGRR
jgi:hypothetical protein